MQRILTVLIIPNIVLVLVVTTSSFTYAQSELKSIYQKTLYEIAKERSTQRAGITVGGNPSAIGVDNSTNTIYVANGVDNSVSVIDGINNTMIGKDIPVGSGPEAIVL